MTTYIGQPADQYRFTSPSLAAAPDRYEERGRCVRKVRPSLSEEGAAWRAEWGCEGWGYDIGFHYICTDNLLGEESVPRERSAILF